MSSCPTASPQTDEVGTKAGYLVLVSVSLHVGQAENVNGRSCPVTGSANQDDCDKLDPRNMVRVNVKQIFKAINLCYYYRPIF